MPLREEPPGVVVSKTLLTFMEKALLLGILFVLIGQGITFHQNQVQQKQNREIKKTQAEGIIRGYILRAVSCDTNKAIGASEPKYCNDPVIQPYRDKNIVPGSTASAKASKRLLSVTCAITRKTNPDVAMLYCAGVDEP